jgi:phage-related protein
MNIGFTFKGVHSSAYGIIAGVSGQLFPEVRKSTIEIPGRDGVLDFDLNSFGPRKIIISCLAKAQSPNALLETLSSVAVWLTGGGWLTLDQDPTKRWQVKAYAGPDMERSPAAALFTVTFEGQPYAEDIDATSLALPVGAYDYQSPVEFYPVITITKGATTASSLTLALASTGETLTINDTLVNTDVISIDMAAGKVTKNGVSIMDKIAIDSLFFGVPPGEQTLTVTTTGAYAVDINYRRRYLYA